MFSIIDTKTPFDHRLKWLTSASKLTYQNKSTVFFSLHPYVLYSIIFRPVMCGIYSVCSTRGTYTVHIKPTPAHYYFNHDITHPCVKAATVLYFVLTLACHYSSWCWLMGCHLLPACSWHLLCYYGPANS